MGIPYLFYNIVKSHPDVVRSQLPKQPSRLFLDFNSIIHMCSAAVVSTLQQQLSQRDLHLKIFKKITEHVMQNIVGFAPPTDCLYIAIDGVAPLAKIQQQRKRRYMTAYRNELINKFKQENGIPVFADWDSNIITPGTEFMKDLDQYLDTFFKNHHPPLPFEVIISGSSEPGEGEHKMIKYMKTHKKISVDGVDAIYGLDADLIMLSLTCEQPGIFLMRESSTFEDIASNNATFKYLDIDRLREMVANDFMSTSDISFMRDYVALCFLLGNDFVPGISFLKIRSKGIKTLVNCYKMVYGSLKEHLVVCENHKHQLNVLFLTHLLEQLAAVEQAEMLKVHTEWTEAKPQFNAKFQSSKLDHYVNHLENYPLTSPSKNKLKKDLSPTHPRWQSMYYQVLFDTHDSAVIQSLTSSYISGLDWILNYYMNHYSDHSWYFEFAYAPTVSDLYMTMFTMEQRQESGRMNITTLNESIQLMLVIPPSSFHVLPKEIRSLVSHTKLSYMFPVKFDMHTYLRQQLWECSPILPSINVNKIIKVIEKMRLN